MFSLSISACLFVLSIERLAGIEWDFHPDSTTYITKSDGETSNFNIRILLGYSFYIFIFLLTC
jgi:hypothetical protein